ncbi:MAG TPA: hypothetical protein ENG49_02990 [Candidatus Omnitrophica bacterium]|nr:hypothetical protein [Candidatus Omnitrophota bacterium]
MKITNILIGICAGISSYKTCTLIRLLRKNNFSVRVVMTPNAVKFVSPLVFSTLSENPVYLEMFEEKSDTKHISLAEWAHLVVVAPLSANTLSKIVCGICDNLLTTVICALPSRVKVILAPAMNENMWKNPTIQKNIEQLRKINRFIILNPTRGKLASGKYGVGRMVEPEFILKEIVKLAKK